VLTRRGLANAEFLRDEQAADAILDEIAVNLGGKVRARILEPAKNLEPAVVRESLDDLSRQGP
jgi:hypothetical protein